MYKIGPRPPQGYIAGDWKETDFIWKGRVRIMEKGMKCEIRLEDPATGKLFVSCPVDDQLDKAVERVVDSSRYFVLRVINGDRQAYLGLGFQERNDAFEFNVALEDHTKHANMEKQERLNPSELRPQEPSLDLGFKSGQTITVNLKSGKKEGAAPMGLTGGAGGFGALLPPPPSASRSRGVQQPQATPAAASSNPNNFFGMFEGGNNARQQPQQQQQQHQQQPAAYFGAPQQQQQQQHQQQHHQQQQPNKSQLFEELMSVPSNAPQQQQQQKSINPLDDFLR
jgi:hypothetical protein